MSHLSQGDEGLILLWSALTGGIRSRAILLLLRFTGPCNNGNISVHGGVWLLDYKTGSAMILNNQLSLSIAASDACAALTLAVQPQRRQDATSEFSPLSSLEHRIVNDVGSSLVGATGFVRAPP